jgi:hypothetical protein
MTRSPRTPPPASSRAGDRSRAGDPRPLNSAGRPVDRSGRPVPGSGGGERSDAAGDRRRSAWDEELRSAPTEDQGGPGGPEPTDWERIRAAGRAGDGPRTSGAPSAGEPPSLAPLLALLDAIRAIVPRDLERQFTALLRELLLTLRALIDWYLERLERGEGERRVEDIPIE